MSVGEYTRPVNGFIFTDLGGKVIISGELSEMFFFIRVGGRLDLVQID